MFSQLVVDFRTPSRSTRLVTWTARLIWILLILLLVLIWYAVRARIVWLVGSPWLIWIWLVWPSWLIWLRFKLLTDTTIRSFTMLPMSNNLSRRSTVLKLPFRNEAFNLKEKRLKKPELYNFFPFDNPANASRHFSSFDNPEFDTVAKNEIKIRFY